MAHLPACYTWGSRIPGVSLRSTPGYWIGCLRHHWETKRQCAHLPPSRRDDIQWSAVEQNDTTGTSSTHLPHPGGMTSNNRWLSEATPPEYHRTIIQHPEGMPSHGAESLPQPTGVLCLGIRIPHIRHPRPLAAQKIQIANVKR